MNIRFDVEQAVRSRYSIRSYDGRSLNPQDLQDILTYAQTIRNPLGPEARWVHLGEEKLSGMTLGTYGVIRGARDYLAAIIPEDPHAPEALGYAFEELVLFAASKGLGTCWLGGTFRKDAFARLLDLQPGEVFPILSPIGYTAQKPSLTERVMRRSVRARKRLPMAKILFTADGTASLHPERLGDYQKPMEMLQLAPSAVNRQPWRVTYDGQAFHFYEEPSMPSVPWDLQRLDVGIAICHFHLSALQMGLAGQISRIDAPSFPHWRYIASFLCE